MRFTTSNWVSILIAFLSCFEISYGATFPLSTFDRHVIDNNGDRFKLVSVNWYGPHTERQVVEGLEFQRLEYMVSLIKEMGFNSVRLPFSNEMLHDSRIVDTQYLIANPQLIGLTALEIFDKTVEALAEQGLAIILNNHTTSSSWCCNYDENGLWFTEAKSNGYTQTTQMWIEDWLMLTERYKDIPQVVGMDLRNEVRTMKRATLMLPISPNWGLGGPTDWHLAAKQAGNAILELNPELLIIVEGINWQGLIPSLGSGWRPVLAPIKEKPINLIKPNKLVYAAHNYAFTGPAHNGDDRYSNGNPRYSDLSSDQFEKTLYEEWLFALESETYYTNPVWISEFGVGKIPPDEQAKKWFKSFTELLIEKDVDFAYWPLNDEEFGLVNSDWSGRVENDWRKPYLDRLISSTKSSTNPKLKELTSLNPRKNDDQQSSFFYNLDWSDGNQKASCPDNFILVGLSSDSRGLCVRSNRLNTPSQYQVIEKGQNPIACPKAHLVKGYSLKRQVESILCVENQNLSDSCRWLEFRSKDNRLSQLGGDWAYKAYKAQCSDNEAITEVETRGSKITSVRCCSLRH